MGTLVGCREVSVVVLATDHRRLLVRLAAPAFEIVEFVGHVLDALDEEGLCECWEVKERLLEKATARDFPFVMMVDANGRLGPAQSGAVGSENSTGQGEGGAGLHSCMRALQMCAPATFFEESAPGTRRALDGKWHGIDWIAAPHTQPHHVREVKVMQQISMNLGNHVDHLPVMVKLGFPQTVWSPRSAPPEFPSRGSWDAPSQMVADSWWVAAPLAPKWWSVEVVNEAPAKYSWMTWAATAPSQAPAPQKKNT